MSTPNSNVPDPHGTDVPVEIPITINPTSTPAADHDDQPLFQPPKKTKRQRRTEMMRQARDAYPLGRTVTVLTVHALIVNHALRQNALEEDYVEISLVYRDAHLILHEFRIQIEALDQHVHPGRSKLSEN